MTRNKKNFFFELKFKMRTFKIHDHLIPGHLIQKKKFQFDLPFIDLFDSQRNE